jgi:hypothetical protein
MKRKNDLAPKRNGCIDLVMFVAFCLVFSPAMLYLGFSSLYDDYALGSRGATLEAAITDTQVEKAGSSVETYSVKYRFTLDGGKTWYACSDRTGRRDLWCGVTAEQWRLTQQTQRVAVIYLPDQPGTNHPVHGTISVGDAAMGVFLGIGPWVALVIILLSHWRNEARAARPGDGA